MSKKYYEQFYANKFDNLDIMDTFLEHQLIKIDLRRNRISE